MSDNMIETAAAGFANKTAAKRAAAAVAKENAAVEKSARGVMFRAAVAMHGAREFIGADKVWATQGDYALAMGYAAKSQGTKLRNLGRAVVVLGVKEGSAVWTYLASNVGAKEVSQAIREATTPEEFARMFDAAKSAVEAAKEKKAEEKAGRVPRPASEKAEEKAEKAETRPATVGEILDALAKSVKSLTDADWTSTQERITALVDRENGLRAAAKRAEANRRKSA